MSKQSPDPELRRAVISGLKQALSDHRLTKSRAAELLGVKRQTLWLYLAGKATPGGDVLRRAFELWGLKIELHGYVITKESFGPQPLPEPKEPTQLDLLDQLEKLSDDQFDVAPLGRRGEYFEFRVRIKTPVPRQ